MNLLQMSFSGAAFITAVVIIRAVAINKLPKKTFLVLWELVINLIPTLIQLSKKYFDGNSLSQFQSTLKLSMYL